MIYARAKSGKSETPSRNVHSRQSNPTGAALTKKSDPFLRDLKEIYDKENINPNTKEHRVKSHHLKNEPHQRSPKNKPVKHNKTYNHQAYYAVKPVKQQKQLESNTNLSSNSKYNHSAELHRNSNARLRTSNRKSTEKDEPLVTHFQEQYYNAKEERQAKKMRVTLKDIKKRKSIHQSQQEYKYQEETKDSLTKDLLLGSLKKEIIKNDPLEVENKLKTESSGKKNEKQHFCCVHPEKRATHRLIDGQSLSSAYCEKCSVSFVTKGHKMEQICPQNYNVSNRLSTRPDERKQSRLDRLKNYLFSLECLEPLLKTNRNEQIAYRSCSFQQFQKEKLALENYYKRLSEQLNISYERSLFTLKMCYESIGEQLQKNEELLNGIVRKIDSIKEDILPNISSIVEEDRVREQDFQTVFSIHEEQLREIENGVRELMGYSYCSYCFDYGGKQQLLIGFREAVEPQILTERKGDSFPETKRAAQIGSSEKRTEHFRLSFGKQVPNSNFKTV